MKKVKEIGIVVAALAVLAIIAFLWWKLTDWTMLYSDRLDRFFGEGKWEVVSDDSKQSRIYKVRVSTDYGSKKEAGSYREWSILCKNDAGEEEIWEISNHVQKINNQKYSVFNPKHYKARQALTLELMDISMVIAEEEIHKNLVSDGLTDEEANCITIHLGYHGGNPKGAFYDKLAKEEWFNINDTTAENYLTTDLYDFYFLFRIHEYRLSQLSEEQQEKVIHTLINMEDRMLKTYGEHASFEILYSDRDIHVEYRDGVKQ